MCSSFSVVEGRDQSLDCLEDRLEQETGSSHCQKGTLGFTKVLTTVLESTSGDDAVGHNDHSDTNHGFHFRGSHRLGGFDGSGGVMLFHDEMCENEDREKAI